MFAATDFTSGLALAADTALIERVAPFGGKFQVSFPEPFGAYRVQDLYFECKYPATIRKPGPVLAIRTLYAGGCLCRYSN